MSDTPRTDEEANLRGGSLMVRADFARQLEREYETAHASLIHALKTIERMERELAQSKAPVLGECEECGHMVVTPLQRLRTETRPLPRLCKCPCTDACSEAGECLRAMKVVS